MTEPKASRFEEGEVQASLRALPSVDRVSQAAEFVGLIAAHGRHLVVEAIRVVLAEARLAEEVPTEATIIERVAARVAARTAPALRSVFNLTGTVLHTNLGRALLSEEAIAHAVMAMRSPANLEFDLECGGRGERDTLVEELLCELTGAEAATAVNNNAGAVLLALAVLGEGREVILSRGELVEIGGAFRIPEVMRCAQVKLVEVGTTNRTHKADYERAIGPNSAALMKVHASNYVVSGFTKVVPEAELAEVARAHGLPLISDLGSGSLVDMAQWGLPKEPVVGEVVAAGCDIVTFSGDKLLGGPQAGLIVGRADLIAKIKKHPMKRALRVSKQTLAALEATLLAYRAPDRIAQTIPTLRLLTRSLDEIKVLAERLRPTLASVLGAEWVVTCAAVKSQIGSGSLPIETIPSMALNMRRTEGKSGKALEQLATRFRALPIPVIGRISGDALLFDLRCLEDEVAFLNQLKELPA